MKQLQIETRPAVGELPILYGGPVETGRGFVLHSGDYEGSDSTLPVSEDISLTATLDILRAIADGRGPKQALFALGYAGWGAGQVESEFQYQRLASLPCRPDAGVRDRSEGQVEHGPAAARDRTIGPRRGYGPGVAAHECAPYAMPIFLAPAMKPKIWAAGIGAPKRKP